MVKLERGVATGEVRKVRTDDGTTTFAERVEWWPGGPARSFTFGNGQTFSQAVTLRYEPRTIRSGPLSLDYTMTPAGDVGAVQDGETAYCQGSPLLIAPGSAKLIATSASSALAS